MRQNISSSVHGAFAVSRFSIACRRAGNRSYIGPLVSPESSFINDAELILLDVARDRSDVEVLQTNTFYHYYTTDVMTFASYEFKCL